MAHAAWDWRTNLKTTARVNMQGEVYLEKASLAAESSSPRAFLNDCNLIFLLSLAVDWVE